jgi:hypothetical protein
MHKNLLLFPATLMLALALVSGVAVAQPPSEQRTGCEKASPSASATPPENGPSSGTAPGNAGSTGWSGGTGGSHIGTSPSGPTKGSEQDHPATARGLDPTKPPTNGRQSPC